MSRDASLLIWTMDSMKESSLLLKTIQEAPYYGSLTDIQQPWFKSPWSVDVESAAYDLSVVLQEVAYIANQGLISKQHLKNLWGPIFVRAWDMLEVWVKFKRHTNNEPLEINKGAFSRIDFEIFAVECKT
jgi:hypothetical protein